MKKDSILKIYNQSLALLTDFYEMTMSFGYWKLNLNNKESVFHLFFRRSPFQGGFTIATGLESVIDFVQNFHFDESDLAYLEKLLGPDKKPYFDKEFLDYLSKMKFTGQIDAVPEGTVVFPYEPILRIQGPLIQCQILESALLNLINFPTLIATKAARICLAAKGEPVLEFGLRRAQGIDGALSASRAAYIGGCNSTSNILAGKLFDIPVMGTHAHSWVMVFDDEMESFKAYATALPNNCVFLVDTYDTIEGVKKAIEVGHWLKKQGKGLLGIRLDSGDLADLSIRSRELLDKAGFKDSFIVGSNELDETIISELKRQGAQINVWGVGTNLVTGKNQSALDVVYKLSAIRDPGKDWQYKLKLSEQMVKVSNPGILQVKRFYDEYSYLFDVMYDINDPLQEGSLAIDPFDATKEKLITNELKSKDLLVPIFIKGKLVYKQPTLNEVRDYTSKELNRFHVGIKRFLNPHTYYVGMEKTIYDKKIDLIKHIRQSSSKKKL